MVEDHTFKLHERHIGKDSEEERKIGRIIAENLVDNGATLQMGIGAVPDAALAALKNHKDLGIHTEMFSDGVLDLVKCNAITNSKKVSFFPCRALLLSSYDTIYMKLIRVLNTMWYWFPVLKP
ncbi:unnamed protein product [Strongylus vulgaris]|uniref:Acetyl-CoA hydrolase/transferase C-terminal domain-containing protein n=1 Tax=Strongylus vulgaris TaxID=40348 RepID=A0A3P7KZK5_STRVU|nr:unnamed protein product [Strongylus vulgaris]